MQPQNDAPPDGASAPCSAAQPADSRKPHDLVAQIMFVVAWLADVRKANHFNFRHSAYGLKHIVEIVPGSPDGYISEAAFIFGALFSGFEMSDTNTPFFNIAEGSLRRKRRAMAANKNQVAR